MRKEMSRFRIFCGFFAAWLFGFFMLISQIGTTNSATTVQYEPSDAQKQLENRIDSLKKETKALEIQLQRTQSKYNRLKAELEN